MFPLSSEIFREIDNKKRRSAKRLFQSSFCKTYWFLKFLIGLSSYVLHILKIITEGVLHMKLSLTKIQYKIMFIHDSGNFSLIIFLYFSFSKIFNEKNHSEAQRTNMVSKLIEMFFLLLLFIHFKLIVCRGTFIFKNIFIKCNCFLRFLIVSSPKMVSADNRKFMECCINTR